MSEQAQAPASRPSAGWTVRRAQPSDAGRVAAAVIELLEELGGERPAAADVEEVAGQLIEDEQAGIVLLAESDDGEVVGVMAASLPTAMHVPGRYALIQDLWVDEAWRSRQIGGALIDALCQIAGEQDLLRLEVGLPKEGFSKLEATEAFYLRNGFDHLGPRMRRLLR